MATRWPQKSASSLYLHNCYRRTMCSPCVTSNHSPASFAQCQAKIDSLKTGFGAPRCIVEQLPFSLGAPRLVGRVRYPHPLNCREPSVSCLEDEGVSSLPRFPEGSSPACILALIMTSGMVKGTLNLSLLGTGKENTQAILGPVASWPSLMLSCSCELERAKPIPEQGT